MYVPAIVGVNVEVDVLLPGLVTLATVAPDGSVTVKAIRLLALSEDISTVTVVPVCVGTNVAVNGADEALVSSSVPFKPESEPSTSPATLPSKVVQL
jgi:hypothetical protein